MLHNFTLAGVAGTLEASVLMGPCLFIPGYVIGWLCNAFGFRKQRFLMQTLLSTPLAVSVLPIVVYLVGRYRNALWILFGASWIAFPFLSGKVWNRWLAADRPKVPKAAWAAVGCACAWALIATSTLVDLQFGDRLYFSVPAFDYSMRVAFTAAASRAIPPANPWFANIPPFPLRYHHFWMLICSLVPGVGSIGPRQAMYAGTIWAGIGLMSAIGIALRFFLQVRDRFGQTLLIACGLLLVTGLDILPTIALYFGAHTVMPDMEWWNVQLTSWPDALLWCSHHVMSLVACMVGFLLIRQSVSTNSQRILSLLIAGISFASAAGLSILVSFTFAVFLALWLPYAVLRRWWDDVIGLSGAAVVAFIVALPYLRSLLGPAFDGYAGGGRFFALWIRPFPFGMIVLGRLFKVPGDSLAFLSIPFLPLNYFLELGFFSLVGIVRIKGLRNGSLPMTRNEETGWMMVVASFLIGTFLRSTSIQSNDLGWRCFLLAQFVLLVWAAPMLERWWRIGRSARRTNRAVIGFAAIMLVLGTAGTLYQIGMLRIYPILLDDHKVAPLESATWMQSDGRLGERTYALRSAYEQLLPKLTAAAIVQYDPQGTTSVTDGLYSLHDVAMADPLCGAVFGGSITQCAARAKSIEPLFEGPTEAETAAVDDVCREYRIRALVVSDTDPIWQHRNSWVWTRRPTIANKFVRAFDCGDFNQQARFGKEKKSF